MKKIVIWAGMIIVFSACTPGINKNENESVFIPNNQNNNVAQNENVPDMNLNSNVYPCPQYAPPPPNWCNDGVIIPQKPDANGCPRPARCQKNENQNISVVTVLKKEGEMCGGIAGFQCEVGLTCQYEGTYPDAAGTCVKTDPRNSKAQPNELCGGFINKQCETGLECIYGPKGSDAGTCAKPNPNKNGVCIQVIASAKDPRTGACWQFPTPCDVPVGWSNCSVQVVP